MVSWFLLLGAVTLPESGPLAAYILFAAYVVTLVVFKAKSLKVKAGGVEGEVVFNPPAKAKSGPR